MKTMTIDNKQFEIMNDNISTESIGKTIGHGFGLMNMMDYCYDKNLSEDNSILVKEVLPNDLLLSNIQEEWYIFGIKEQ